MNVCHRHAVRAWDQVPVTHVTHHFGPCRPTKLCFSNRGCARESVRVRARRGQRSEVRHSVECVSRVLLYAGSSMYMCVCVCKAVCLHC